MTNNWILTGEPGIGKTTVIQRTVSQLRGDGITVAGIIAPERRSEGGRTGFDIASLDGSIVRQMASRDWTEEPKIGAYGVDVQAIDTVTESVLPPARRHADVVVIDEIGPMQTRSDRFVAEVRETIAATVPTLVSIKQAGLSDRLRMVGANEFTPIEVTEDNREELPDQLTAEMIRHLETSVRG